MSDYLIPGPYRDNKGCLGVIACDKPDSDGDYVFYTESFKDPESFRDGVFTYRKPADLMPADEWPEWFPFKTAEIPERPKRTPKVGEFWETSDWGTAQVIAVQPDRVHILFDDVDEMGTIHTTAAKLLAPATRPTDWPL